MRLNEKCRQQLLESARLAGEWYCNCQNTPRHPWGGVEESADEGRFIYEYFPATGKCRGMGVWGQAVAIMALLPLSKSVQYEGDKYEYAAKLAGEYLKSLQVINPSDKLAHGAFCEHTPQTRWSYPRDAATGAMGFLALYVHTKEQEFLDRAKLFGEWFHGPGGDKGHWPHGHFDFVKGPLDGAYIRGDWQIGGGLVYPWLTALTGETKWMDQYYRPQIDALMDLYDRNADAPVKIGFHGFDALSFSNDDFAMIAMVCAYRHWREERMLNIIRHHMRRLWQTMDDDGSYPSYAGTFVTNIETIEYVDLAREMNLKEDFAGLEQRILKTATFGMTLQETQLRDPRAYGGFYGQSHYGVSRDRIHHRDAGYSMIMDLRLVGATPVPYYSAYGWAKPK